MNLRDQLIVALDTNSLETAKKWVDELLPWVGCFKVGLELLTAEGAPQVIRTIQGLGGHVFLDGKFHDIPSTVAKASASVAALGVRFFDVHATSGLDALQSAVHHRGQSQVFAVTVLTSLNQEKCKEIYGQSVEPTVTQLALLAQEAGVDGVVCSPIDLAMLNRHPRLSKFTKMTPGVRPSWADPQDQSRIMTPSEAIRAGSSYLIVGRPITQPPRQVGTPAVAAQKILEEMASAL